MSVQAVIFDIGGVLVRTLDWGGRTRWEQRFGLPEGGLSAMVFDTEYAVKASTGLESDEFIWRHVAASLNLSDATLVELRSDFWAGDVANDELVAFLHTLRPEYKTGILSNAWPEMRDMNEFRFGLTDVVNSAVYSFQIGVLKPSPAAYEAIVDQLAVNPHNAIFVDDSATNIEGACRFGLQTVQFTTTLQTIADISRMLALT